MGGHRGTSAGSSPVQHLLIEASCDTRWGWRYLVPGLDGEQPVGPYRPLVRLKRIFCLAALPRQPGQKLVAELLDTLPLDGRDWDAVPAHICQARHVIY